MVKWDAQFGGCFNALRQTFCAGNRQNALHDLSFVAVRLWTVAASHPFF